ncbi:GspE/PulE family protein [Parvibium lacunae]|uniref:Secretion system protein E n=1 Tax=Parvibium lacunae TaxID=1888893 RepID=A0A368KYS1_9BURK|nr:ATPase, T2SS/T4P/T4SS family [Parvibium lacunae]RCS56568.1 secretion system protein E [Parvibium lacunae]
MTTAPSSTTKPRRLGDILRERGLISDDQLRIALLEQQRQGKPLGKVLVELGFVSDAILREALSENLGQETIELTKIVADRNALKLIPHEFAKRHTLYPVSWDAHTRLLTVAMANPNNVVVLDQLSALLRGEAKLDIRIAAEGDVARAIDQYYGYELSIDGILNEIETGEIDYQSLVATGDEYSQPIVRLIDALLSDAVQRRASDIHFEPEAGFVRIRYRIDGVLRQIRALHHKYWPAMVVRLKVLSDMNIAENRAPQDGRISIFLQGRQIDFRVAAQPTTHGENIVLRILDRQRGLVPLDQLGLPPAQLDTLQLMMARPEGIILVTGPTGSGKTTTLYSVLNALNSEQVNIMTLEDPVEYPLNMIRQTNLAEGVKMDFASGIRSMMRQDPDIILVGEIRDGETAEMALRAAMTGHQVYTTLHTNSALGAIPRLLDLGLKPDILAGNIIGVLAQRLVRKLCVHCRQPYQPSSAQLALLGVDATQPVPTLYEAVGCEHCEWQGYQGRVALMEIIRMNDALDELIARHATLRELTRMARQQGMHMLAEDAIRRVLDGTTALEEAARVVDLTSL